jgi:hypothetical protein
LKKSIVLAVFAAVLAVLAAVLTSTSATAQTAATPAIAHVASAKPVAVTPNANPACKNKTTKVDPRYGTVTVYYCDISRPADVDNANTCEPHQSQCWGAAGRLVKAGYANWFVCQAIGYIDGIDWAYTEADNGEWGWVDAWDYAGTSSKWPLPSCGSTDPQGASPL